MMDALYYLSEEVEAICKPFNAFLPWKFANVPPLRTLHNLAEKVVRFCKSQKNIF